MAVWGILVYGASALTAARQRRTRWLMLPVAVLVRWPTG